MYLKVPEYFSCIYSFGGERKKSRNDHIILCGAKKKKHILVSKRLRFSPRKRYVLVFLLCLPFPLLLDNFVELLFVEF